MHDIAIQTEVVMVMIVIHTSVKFSPSYVQLFTDDFYNFNVRSLQKETQQWALGSDQTPIIIFRIFQPQPFIKIIYYKM